MDIAGLFCDLVLRAMRDEPDEGRFGDIELLRVTRPRDYQPWDDRNLRPGQELDGVELGWVHIGKVFDSLAEVLVETGLGVRSRDGGWIGLHPRLAAVYLSALAEQVASANDMPVITDRLRAYGVLNGWDIDVLADALLGESDDRPPTRDADDVSALYAAVAISAVVPDGLENIPPDRIVTARQTLAVEFDAFRSHLDSMSDVFTELAKIDSPEVLKARLELLVERDLRRPTADLERSLRQIGMEPARAVFGLKSLELAAALAGAGVPAAVGQAGLVAAQLVGSGIRAQPQARSVRHTAAGYLLGLREELSPAGIVDRVRRTRRHARRRR